MFDYKYGIKTSEKSYLPKAFLRRVLDPPSEYRTLLNIYEFLEGMEILTICSLINHRFHNASWRFEIWKNQCFYIGHPDRIQALEVQVYNTVEKHFKKANARGNLLMIHNETELCLIEYNPTEDYKRTILWKIIYAHLLFKTCYECGVPEKKLRYLPLLTKTLCFNCTKLEKFAMLSQETAELNYGITAKDLNLYKVPGLKVPNQYTPGKPMLVYYEKDISAIWEKKSCSLALEDKNLTAAEEKRKIQLIHCLKEEGVHDMDFIKRCIETDDALGLKYVQGKSRQGAKSIAQTLARKFGKLNASSEFERKAKIRERAPVKKSDKDTLIKNSSSNLSSLKPSKSEIPTERKHKISLDIEDVIELSDDDNIQVNDEPKIIKKPKLELTPQEKAQRKKNLIERLKLMGVPEDKIGLDDPTSLASEFIQGRTKDDLGPVAGAIWRENKPVFTGISFRTTQRLSDIDS